MNQKVAETIARIKVVLTAAVTWLIVASTIITIMSEEIAAVLPDGAATTVGAVALKIVSIISAAVAIIRRVTPVLPEERGLLPKTPLPETPEVEGDEEGH